MHIKEVQQKELAGKTKLTAVTLYISPSKPVTRFAMLLHDGAGNPILPITTYSKILQEGREKFQTA